MYLPSTSFDEVHFHMVQYGIKNVTFYSSFGNLEGRSRSAGSRCVFLRCSCSVPPRRVEWLGEAAAAAACLRASVPSGSRSWRTTLAASLHRYLVGEEFAEIRRGGDFVDDFATHGGFGAGEDLLDDVGAVLLSRELGDLAEDAARDTLGLAGLALLDEVLGWREREEGTWMT